MATPRTINDRVRRQLFDGVTFTPQTPEVSNQDHMFVDTDNQLRLGVTAGSGIIPNVVAPGDQQIPVYNASSKTWVASSIAQVNEATGSFLKTDWTVVDGLTCLSIPHELNTQTVAITVFDTTNGTPTETYVDAQPVSNSAVLLSVAPSATFSGSYILSAINYPGTVLGGSIGSGGGVGATGATGATGAASTVAGPTGPTGATGAPGATGATGANSTVAGPTGPTGATGANGATGNAGVISVNGATGTVSITAASISAVATSAVGANSGVASLDVTGKVPTSQLPAAILGAMNYQGVWDASANSPTLVSGTGTKGYYYKVSNAGTTLLSGISQWNVGDMVTFDGLNWDKIDGLPSEVSSVAGRVGAVVLSVGDVSGAAPLASPTFTGTVIAPTPTAGDNSTKVATTAFVASGTQQPYDMAGFFQGKPAASSIIYYVPVVRSFTLPQNLTGSKGVAQVAAAASTTFTIYKNGTSIGTMVFAASSSTATFTFASAISFSPGDILEVICPGTADANLANIGFAFMGSIN